VVLTGVLLSIGSDDPLVHPASKPARLSNSAPTEWLALLFMLFFISNTKSYVEANNFIYNFVCQLFLAKYMEYVKENPAQATRPRSRAEAKAQSRQALIESAMALIPTRGLDVSLDELCAHAGYTRGAFYQHFEDRDALVAAVTEQFAEHLLESVLSKLTGESTFDLASIASSVLGLMQRGEYPIGRGGVMRSYQLLQACDRSPLVRQQYISIYEKTLLKFTELVRQAQDQGLANRSFDAGAVATLCIALIVGLRTLNDVGAPIDLDALKTVFSPSIIE